LISLHGNEILYGDRLKDFDRLLSTADHFLQIHTLLLGTAENLRQHLYVDSQNNIETIQRLFCALDLHEDMEKCVQKALQMELCVSRESLMFALSEAWGHWLVWTMPVADTRRGQALKTSTTSLDIRTAVDISNIVQTMVCVGMLDTRLKTFVDRMMTFIIEPVVRDDGTTILEVVSEPDRCLIRVTVLPPSASVPALPVRDSTTMVNNAFHRLEQIFVALHDILVTAVPTTDVGSPSKNTALVPKLGRHLTTRVFECLYRDCLTVALPKSRSSLQWETYRNVIAHAERFQETLMRLGLFSKGQPSLMDYLNNVNSLFANVKSAEILMRAHQLMTLELTTSVEVSADEPLGAVSKVKGSDAEWDMFIKKCRETAGTSNFKHPSCRVR